MLEPLPYRHLTKNSNLVRRHCEELGVGFAINTAFADGGKGAEDLARLVVETIEQKSVSPAHLYV